jgi:hypothetical protein
MAKDITEAIDAMAERSQLEEAIEAPSNDDRFGVWAPETAKAVGVKLLLYGTSGSGKTWMASTFPKPLFVDMEGGLKGIAKAMPYRLPKDPNKVISNLKELRAAYATINAALLAGSAPFETVVLDSISEMQELVMRNVLESYRISGRQYDDQPTLADYGKAMRDFMAILRAFLQLPCHVVLTAVVAPKKFPEDQNAPTFVGQKTGPEVCRLVDEIGYTYSVSDKDEVKYLVSFANTPDHVAKDRLGFGPKSRPNNFKYLKEPK